MRKKTVKRCIRPQCMEVYPEDTPSKYCDCGALLQVTEIEIPDRKTFVPKEGPGPKEENPNDGKKSEGGETHISSEKTVKVQKLMFSETSKQASNENEFDFFGENIGTPASSSVTSNGSHLLGHLYLIPENETDHETEYILGIKTIIGRTSDTMAVDVDLSQFGGLISRKHALITCEKDGFYITNLSENHSVHVNNKVVAHGQKMKLASEDGIILSKKVLLQFEEGE